MSQQNNSSSPTILDSKELSSYIESFFGYGNLYAPVWFVGMEEGGGGSADEIGRRLDAWRDRGRPVLDDLAEFHNAFGEGRLFHEGAPIQRTWKELIRVALMIDGHTVDNASIRSYQINGFGQAHGPVALLELLPLPKPSTSSWPYAHWTCPQALPHLQKQRLYKKHVMQDRIDAIRRLANRHQPRAIVFYGKSYLRHWESIASHQFERSSYPMTIRSGTTTYMLLPHPTARGGSQTPHYTRTGSILQAILTN